MTCGRSGHAILKALAGFGILAVLIAAGLMIAGGRTGRESADTHTLARERFELWLPFDGDVQAVHEMPVFSRISRPVPVIELAPEGTLVNKGDIIASFDAGEIEQLFLTAERDYRLAEAEHRTLVEAELPMELETVRAERDKLAYAATKEQQILERTRDLQTRDLVSDQEVETQRMAADSAQRQVDRIRSRLENLESIVHPAKIAKAEAQLEAARRQYELMQDQLSNTVLTAEISGMVVYVPLHIDGEYRTVREGDSVYRNQRFMTIADMNSLVVVCRVPESQVSRIDEGDEAWVTPSAFPGLRLSGRVEAIGSMAMSVQGRPAWQKFFTVTIRLDEGDPRLRSSMSAYAQVLAHVDEDALTLPRRFVAWDGQQALAWVGARGSPERREIETGPGNDTSFVVTSGVKEGETVVLPPSP